MKKFNILLLSIVLIIMAGCTKQSDNGNKETTNADFNAIVHAIKEQMAKDMKEDGVEEEVLVDGELLYYIQTDLTASEESDPGVPIWLEKMDLNQGDLAKGVVIAPMMNVKSDEIIVLEAKDEAKVDSLKASLEKELEAQELTWQQYLPDQYEKVKQNVIKTKGKYLIYITYTNPEKIEKVFENQF